MAIKTSNVAARVEPEIKERAEAILASLGISASAGINMFYRQIILMNGLPFRPTVPVTKPLSLEDMSRDEFEAFMTERVERAKKETGRPAETVLCEIKQEQY